MRHIPCLLIDDDPEEHELFRMAIEGHFNSGACDYARDIFSAVNALNNHKINPPDTIFIDWSVISADPQANLLLLKTAFPHAANKIILLSGHIPLIDPERLGIYRVLRKQFSIETYGKMIAEALVAVPQTFQDNHWH